MKNRLAPLLAALLFCFAPVAMAVNAVQLAPEQYKACLPQVDVFFYPLGEDGNVDASFQLTPEAVSAVLGGKELAVQAVADRPEGTLYIALVDISGSVPAAVFKAVREGLCDWVDNLGPNDQLALITFGSDVTTVLRGSEPIEAAKEAIQAIRASARKTRLFDAVSQAIAFSKTAVDAPLRKVILLVTDGKDVSDGGSATQEEALEALHAEGLPLYALGIGSNKTYLDALGEFVRASNGRMYTITKANALSTMLSLKALLESVRHITLRTETNLLGEPEQQLVIKIASGGAAYTLSQSMSITSWQADTLPPAFLEARITDEHTIVAQISEPVSGADDPSNYSLQQYLEQEDGVALSQSIHPVSAIYDERTGTLTLTFDESLYAGIYSLGAEGIADISMEKNPISTPFEIDNTTGVTLSFWQTIPWWGYLLAALAVLCLAYCIHLLIKHKKRKQAEGLARQQRLLAQQKAQEEAARKQQEQQREKERQQLQAEAEERAQIRQGSKHVQIVLMDADSGQRKAEVLIPAAPHSFVIGREAGGEYGFKVEDRGVSRRHCELIHQEGSVIIRDLGSQNGTQVNGIPIHAPRKLMEGDWVNIGNSKFSIRF